VAVSWDDLNTADTVADDRMSLQWASQGEGGSGKTHFLLTAPDPIFVALFDPKGVEPLLKRPEFKKKDIRWRAYGFNPGKLSPADRPKAAQEALAQFLEDYRTALANARTIGFDKEDHVYETLRYARLHAYTDRPSNYYELNLEYRGWFADAAEAGVNLGAIRGMKEKWGLVDGKPTGLGTLEPRGQREVNELVQVVLNHYWDTDERKFKIRIGGQEGDQPKCRVGAASDLMGEVRDDLDFASLVAELYPDVDASEWGL
jgi:hypothetical protein